MTNTTRNGLLSEVHIKRFALVVFIAMSFVVSLALLSGCKYSDVLTQHLEDPDLGVLDENAAPTYKSNPDSHVILDLTELSEEESDQINNQTQMMPHYDPNAPDNGPTTQRIQSKDTPHDEEASEGDDEEQEEQDQVSGEGSGDETAENAKEKSDESGSSNDKNSAKSSEPETKDPDAASEDNENDEKTDEDTSENNEESNNDDSDQTGDDDNKGGDDNQDPLSGDDNTTSQDGNSESGDKQGTSEIKDDDSDEQGDNTEQSSGQGGQTVIVDPEKGQEEPPATGTVAAVGEYATIAQMLGGAGALAAADEEWLSARRSDGCFSGELDKVAVGFAGDGGSNGDCYVDTLINEAKPSVVLWDGAHPALSDSDRAALEDAGIKVQAVPTIGEQTTEDYTVTQAVQQVAAVLNGAAGLSYDPVQTATNYVSFHDERLRLACSDNGGYSYKLTESSYDHLYQNTYLSGLGGSTTSRQITAFVDDLMRPSVTSAKVEDQSALLANGESIRLSHDGKVVDVSDGVALSAATGLGSYMLIDYYLQLAGFMNNAYDRDKPDSQNRRYMIMPGKVPAFGESGAYAKRSTKSTLFFNGGDGTARANWHWLGNPDFPALIAANEDIANALYDSAKKEDGLYRMDDSYRILVVPSGIGGSWAEGHIDSFLLSRWAFGLKDASFFNTVKGDVDQFYQGFLRCSDWESSGAVRNWDSPDYVTPANGSTVIDDSGSGNADDAGTDKSNSSEEKSKDGRDNDGKDDKESKNSKPSDSSTGEDENESKASKKTT